MGGAYFDLSAKLCDAYTAQKISFPLRISLVNVTKSAVSCGFLTFTEETLNGKLHFLCNVIKGQLLFETRRLIEKTRYSKK